MMYDSLSLVGGGGIAVTSSALKDTANGHRSSMSYLSVGERGERGEVCANGSGGGCDGASTGSDSLSAGQTSDETKRQQRSPLLSPNMELERARAKIRLLQKEVSQYHLDHVKSFLIVLFLCVWDVPVFALFVNYEIFDNFSCKIIFVQMTPYYAH